MKIVIQEDKQEKSVGGAPIFRDIIIGDRNDAPHVFIVNMGNSTHIRIDTPINKKMLQTILEKWDEII